MPLPHNAAISTKQKFARSFGGVQGILLRPYRVASFLTVTALAVALVFLTYTAWSSTRHLAPLERHLIHMQGLQDASLSIQELLVHHLNSQSNPQPAEVAKISQQLATLLLEGDSLHPDTPQKLREAQQFLDNSVPNTEVGLLAALSIVREVLAKENQLQHTALAAVRAASVRETIIAAISLVLVPLSAWLILSYLRRRTFEPLQNLGVMLENVGNLEFEPTSLPDASDPFFHVYDRYNHMTTRLREVQHENTELQSTLKAQVRAATETLLQQQRDLADGARLAAIGEFSARLAHELRNPLSGILMALRNMEREAKSADERERLNAIIEEIERIKRLLAGLLDKSPQSPESPAPINLADLVGEVVTLFSYQLDEDISVHTDVASVICSVPRDTLRQVVLNLLRNSADALEGRKGRISVSAGLNGNQLELTVADTGPGYPQDLLRYGIRPFWTQKMSGSGLGLAVVKRLVHSAGGELHLSNNDDGGARAHINLPCEAS